MEVKGKILLVEDDKNFGDVLCSYLEMNDFEVVLEMDGDAGYQRFKKENFDLCIFDVMMPKKDGISLAKEIRQDDQNIPIIFLTAKTLKEDIIKGFQAGADDYIPKPFAPEELLYRIQAILKRSQKPERKMQDIKEFIIGRFHFNYPLRLLTFNKEKDCLLYTSPSPRDRTRSRMPSSA